MGVIAVEYEGRGYVWRDDGLHRVNDRGEVDLSPVDVDDLVVKQVAEVDRSRTHAWDFQNSTGESAASPEAVESADTDRVATASNGGDPSPDNAV